MLEPNPSARIGIKTALRYLDQHNAIQNRILRVSPNMNVPKTSINKQFIIKTKDPHMTFDSRKSNRAASKTHRNSRKNDENTNRSTLYKNIGRPQTKDRRFPSLNLKFFNDSSLAQNINSYRKDKRGKFSVALPTKFKLDVSRFYHKK